MSSARFPLLKESCLPLAPVLESPPRTLLDSELNEFEESLLKLGDAHRREVKGLKDEIARLLRKLDEPDRPLRCKGKTLLDTMSSQLAKASVRSTHFPDKGTSESSHRNLPCFSSGYSSQMNEQRVSLEEPSALCPPDASRMPNQVEVPEYGQPETVGGLFFGVVACPRAPSQPPDSDAADSLRLPEDDVSPALVDAPPAASDEVNPTLTCLPITLTSALSSEAAVSPSNREWHSEDWSDPNMDTQEKKTSSKDAESVSQDSRVVENGPGDRRSTVDPVKNEALHMMQELVLRQLVIYPIWLHVLHTFRNKPISDPHRYGPRKSLASQFSFKSRALQLRDIEVSGTSADVIYQRVVARLVCHPGSGKRLGWDAFGIFMVLYDLITLPMQAFGEMNGWVFDVVRYSGTFYWTFDVIVAFFTGYIVDGVVVLRHQQIAFRYLRTWFVFDFTMAMFDWLVILVIASSSDATGPLASMPGSVRVHMRILRVLRMLRLLRVVKVQTTVSELFSRIRSDYVQTLVGVMKLMLFILGIVHLIACGWYGLAEERIMLEEGAVTWVTTLDDMSPEQANSILYKYWTAMHWSITQFTPASMEVTPVNVPERIFTVIVVLLAMILFSSLVSGITNAMSNLRRSQDQRLESEATLRRYLFEKEVSSQLVMRVWRYIAQRRQRTQRICETEVTILKDLPEAILIELHQQVYMPVMDFHPVFHRYSDEYFNMMVKICHLTASQQLVRLGEDLFSAGETARHMTFVAGGNILYWLDNSMVLNNSAQSDQQSDTVGDFDPSQDIRPSAKISGTHLGKEDNWVFEKGHWFCEAALWMHWETRGRAVAQSNAELVTLDASKFHAVVKQDLLGFVPFAKYAKLYYAHVKDSAAKGRLITDVWMSTDDVEDLNELQGMIFDVFDDEELSPYESVGFSGQVLDNDESYAEKLRRRASISSMASSAASIASWLSQSVKTSAEESRISPARRAST